jgi:hypothetical protein
MPPDLTNAEKRLFLETLAFQQQPGADMSDDELDMVNQTVGIVISGLEDRTESSYKWEEGVLEEMLNVTTRERKKRETIKAADAQRKTIDELKHEATKVENTLKQYVAAHEEFCREGQDPAELQEKLKQSRGGAKELDDQLSAFAAMRKRIDRQGDQRTEAGRWSDILGTLG